MTKNEFRQRLVLRYLNKWIDRITDSTDAIVYSEDSYNMGFNSSSEQFVNDAYDIAECTVNMLFELNKDFFDS